MESKNITEHHFSITKNDRRIQNKHTSFAIWFTGFSGAGKSTLANGVENRLFQNGIHTYVLDGDNVRKGLNKDLEFSDKDREENIRRVGEVSKLFVDAGIVVIAAFISPFKKDREEVRKIIQPDHFIEIFVDTSIQECERRDTKGLYKKARKGEISNFPGISSDFEKPINPEIIVKTEDQTIDESVDYIIKKLNEIVDLKF